MIIDSRLPTALAWCEGGQTFDIEPGDQVGDGVAGASAGVACGLLVVIAAGDGQEHGGSSDLDGGSGPRPTEIGQGLPLGIGERPERILLAAGHRWPPCRREAAHRSRNRPLWPHTTRM